MKSSLLRALQEPKNMDANSVLEGVQLRLV